MQDTAFDHHDLREILVDRIGLNEVPDDPATAFADLGLDSLAMVELLLAIQQEYGFQVPDEDAHRLKTLADAIDYVNRRLQAPEVV
jgi:acyl carrier protein